MTNPMHERPAELALCAPVDMLQAEAVPEGGAPALRRFAMNAYTGGAMTLRG